MSRSQRERKPSLKLRESADDLILPPPPKLPRQHFFSDARTNARVCKALGIPPGFTYQHHPFDQISLFTVQPVDILSSVGHPCYGLYATQDIEAGTCLGVYYGAVYQSGDFEHYLSTHRQATNHYAMAMSGDYIIDAEKEGNFARFMNHSDIQANVEFVKDERVASGESLFSKVIATQNIPAGAQILVNYGQNKEAESEIPFLFLNPEDGPDSAATWYQKHKKQYRERKLNYPSLLADGSWKIPLVADKILDGEDLSHQKLLASALDFPCLLLKPNKSLYPFSERDTFTPLMLACYLGQVKNVEWLLSKAVNVNRQQNQSGNGPLFFALQGYKDQASKSNHIKIILSLLEHGANVKTYNRHHQTFLHWAGEVLSTRDFEKVLQVIPDPIRHLCTYVDNRDFDIAQNLIYHKKTQNLLIFLKYYPRYFQDYYQVRKGGFREFEFNTLLEAFQNYSQEEYIHLFGQLRRVATTPFENQLWEAVEVTLEENERPRRSLA